MCAYIFVYTFTLMIITIFTYFVPAPLNRVTCSNGAYLIIIITSSVPE